MCLDNVFLKRTSKSDYYFITDENNFSSSLTDSLPRFGAAV